MYCTRCNKVFVFVFDQDVGDVTKDRSDGRPVWLEMPRQQPHRHISITPRKNTELLLILLVVTRHNYWIATLFSMHFVKSVWLLSEQDGRPWFMYCTRCNKVFVFVIDRNVGDVTNVTPRKNIELLLILLVVTRHNYWVVTLFSMHSNISF